MSSRVAVLALVFAGVVSTTLPLQAGVDLWTPLSSPQRGFILPVVVDPERPSTLYVVGSGLSALWKSFDGGATWALLAGGPDRLELGGWPLLGPVFDPWDSRRLWVWSEYTVWFSADGGGHWTQRLAPDLQPLAIDQLVPDPVTPERLLAVSDRTRVIASDDGGASWEPLGELPAGSTLSRLSVHPADPTVLFAHASSGLFRSGDGGHTWTLASDYQGGGFQALEIAPSRPGTLYAVPDAASNRLLRSDDGGATWQHAGPPGVVLGIASLLVDPTDEREVRLVVYRHSGQFLLTSHDGGKTWPGPALPVPGPFLVSDPRSAGTLYTAPDLQRSTDGGRTWRPLGHEIQAGDLFSIAAAAEGRRTVLYASVFEDGQNLVYRSDDVGRTWRAASRPRIGLALIAADPGHTGRLFGLGSSGVYRSDDRGGAWRRVSPPGLDVALDLLVDRARPDRLFVATRFGGVWRSEDAGATWVQSIEGLPIRDDCPHFWICPVVGPIAVDTAAPDRVFVVVDGGLYRSLDGGSSWQGVGAGLPSTLSVVTHPFRAGVVFAGTVEGVLESDDGGATWARLAGLDAAVRHLLLEATSLDLYAATDVSIYRRRVAGPGPFEWQDLAAGLPRLGFAEVRGLVADPRSPGRVYAALSNFGVWTGRFVGARPLGLHGGRFEVRTALAKSTMADAGWPVRLAPDGGGAGREDCGPVETLVRLARDRGTFGISAGALTRKEVELTVVDRLSGLARTYLLPRGGRRALVDLGAFPAAPLARPAKGPGASPEPAEASACAPGEVALGERYCAGARLATRGVLSAAGGASLRGVCGEERPGALFSREDSSSFELGVRVSEQGQSATLFYTVLTRRPWELTVTDRESGKRWTYTGSGRPSSRVVELR